MTRYTNGVIDRLLPHLYPDHPTIDLSSKPYSNFTVDFKDLLDYIYVSSDLFGDPKDISPLPLPSYDILTENTAIPSAYFPSDHLPIAVDLPLK